MIQRVAGNIGFRQKINKAQNKEENGFYNKIKNSKVALAADSFCTNTVKSTPVLLGFTALWTGIDKIARHQKIKDSLKNNLKNMFIPTLLVSSAILTVVELSGRKKENK